MPGRGPLDDLNQLGVVDGDAPDELNVKVAYDWQTERRVLIDMVSHYLARCPTAGGVGGSPRSDRPTRQAAGV